MALGLLGFSAKVGQPCLLPHSAVFLHPPEASHSDRHGRVFENSQGKMKLPRKSQRGRTGHHGFRLPVSVEYTGCEHPDQHMMPTEVLVQDAQLCESLRSVHDDEGMARRKAI